MHNKEDVEGINTKIAAGFENIEKKLAEAKNIAELFEILFAGIEKEFQVPFVWLTLKNTRHCRACHRGNKIFGYFKRQA